MQGRRGENQDGIALGENTAGKVSETLEIAPAMMPSHPRPVIEALHWEMEIFGGLQFDYGKAAIAGDAEQIDHGAVSSGKGRHLRIKLRGIEARIEQGNVALNYGLQPALGLQPIERMVVIAPSSLEQ